MLSLCFAGCTRVANVYQANCTKQYQTARCFISLCEHFFSFLRQRSVASAGPMRATFHTSIHYARKIKHSLCKLRFLTDQTFKDDYEFSIHLSGRLNKISTKRKRSIYRIHFITYYIICLSESFHVYFLLYTAARFTYRSSKTKRRKPLSVRVLPK